MAVRSRLTSFEQVPMCFAGWDGTIEQVTCGRFEGSLQVVRSRAVRVIRITGTQSLRLRGQENGTIVSLTPVLPGNAAGVWHGQRLDPGQVVVRGPDAGIDHRSARTSEYLNVSVPVAALEAATRAIGGPDPLPALRAWAVLTPRPDDYRALGLATDRLLGATGDWPVLSDPEAGQFEQEYLRLVARALGTGEEAGRSPTLPARLSLLSRAEELMRGSLRSPLGVLDLCAALGASDRTLRLVFKEQYGCGPMTFYRRLRLNAVRTRLAADAGVPVAAAAREYGFTHLGNFAADYRRHFGERPSETGRG
ncbi:helix-turn-helix domain-containing protein [Urbifossiella limnaea]|uniref:Transcriptional regulator EutR n=1 Tax=Urbifossiella limnaea TaxID=2528023 RepID=A0A517Y293_9BACT|nr:helix-turn-helix domain-containing protein [Urbifossiella limnaea]QDU23906.1 transcriptional regulator EutR [Urbifossiella limnaea]